MTNPYTRAYNPPVSPGLAIPICGGARYTERWIALYAHDEETHAYSQETPLHAEVCGTGERNAIWQGARGFYVEPTPAAWPGAVGRASGHPQAERHQLDHARQQPIAGNDALRPGKARYPPAHALRRLPRRGPVCPTFRHLQRGTAHRHRQRRHQPAQGNPQACRSGCR